MMHECKRLLNHSTAAEGLLLARSSTQRTKATSMDAFLVPRPTDSDADAASHATGPTDSDATEHAAERDEDGDATDRDEDGDATENAANGAATEHARENRVVSRLVVSRSELKRRCNSLEQFSQFGSVQSVGSQMIPARGRQAMLNYYLCDRYN